MAQSPQEFQYNHDPYDDEKRYDSIEGIVASRLDLDNLDEDPDKLYDMGLLLHFKKDYDGAIDCLERANRLYGRKKNFIGVIRCLIELAWLKYNESDEGSSKASRAFAEAQEMVEAHINERGINEIRARLLHYKGLVKYRMGHYGEGVKFFKQAQTFCWHDGLDAAKIHDSLGIHYERTGDFHRAIKSLEASLRIKRDLGIPWEEAVTAQILGRLHLIKEDFDLAHKFLMESREVSDSLSDIKRVASLNNVLIKLYIHQGKLDQARVLIQQIEHEHNGTKPPRLPKEYGITQLYKAFILFSDRHFNESFELLSSKVIPLFEENKAKKGLGKAFRLRSRLECEFGDYKKALETMGEALALFKELNLVDEQAKTHFEFGKIFMEMNDKKLALKSLLEALRVAEDNGLRFLTSYIEDELYRTDVERWQEIIDKRAQHQRIFEKDRTLLDALTSLSESDEQIEKDASGSTSDHAKSMISLLRVAQAMSGERDLEKLLELVMEETKYALDCDRCTVFIYDQEQNELWSRIASGLDDNKEIRFPAHLGLAGYVCKTGEVLNIKDAYDDPRFNKEVDKKTGYKTENLLCMPMRNRQNEIVGVFQVLNKRNGHFEKTDEDLLMAISSQAGVALENAKLASDQKTAFESFITTLSRTIDARDPITAGHSERVAQYAQTIGVEMHLNDEETETLVYSSLLHDIGKIGIREDILTKDGRLTEKEYRHIQKHAEYTYEILKNIHFEKHLKRVPEIAASHHEKMDGTGYFRGLKGNEIPLLGRILALSDVFDAITSRRHYRNRMPFDRVLKILAKDSGSHFDPDCVDAFFNVSLSQLGQILLVEKRIITPEMDDALSKSFGELSISIREYAEILQKEKMTKAEADIHRIFTHLYHRGELDNLD